MKSSQYDNKMEWNAVSVCEPSKSWSVTGGAGTEFIYLKRNIKPDLLFQKPIHARLAPHINSFQSFRFPAFHTVYWHKHSMHCVCRAYKNQTNEHIGHHKFTLYQYSWWTYVVVGPTSHYIFSFSEHRFICVSFIDAPRQFIKSDTNTHTHTHIQLIH